MKDPVTEADRWLKQSLHNLAIAQGHKGRAEYAEACFVSEQAAQMALKAYLTLKGERFILAHSVRKLVEKCAVFDPALAELIEPGKILDKYYLTTRYPDVLPSPAVPWESFTEKEAGEAVAYAEKIVQLVQRQF
ncbi:MAG: HEPN domain-containing protein [Elusimicrobia bacterium]|nr:MAG: HEPN domain-containing protein [Elusimicrobiota bacterium]KAF0155869.1 MAG: HEPN domain-containing protein [Elusimicrobiota bacterium]